MHFYQSWVNLKLLNVQLNIITIYKESFRALFASLVYKKRTVDFEII